MVAAGLIVQIFACLCAASKPENHATSISVDSEGAMKRKSLTDSLSVIRKARGKLQQRKGEEQLDESSAGEVLAIVSSYGEPQDISKAGGKFGGDMKKTGKTCKIYQNTPAATWKAPLAMGENILPYTKEIHQFIYLVSLKPGLMVTTGKNIGGCGNQLVQGPSASTLVNCDRDTYKLNDCVSHLRGGAVYLIRGPHHGGIVGPHQGGNGMLSVNIQAAFVPAAWLVAIVSSHATQRDPNQLGGEFEGAWIDSNRDCKLYVSTPSSVWKVPISAGKHTLSYANGGGHNIVYMLMMANGKTVQLGASPGGCGHKLVSNPSASTKVNCDRDQYKLNDCATVVQTPQGGKSYMIEAPHNGGAGGFLPITISPPDPPTTTTPTISSATTTSVEAVRAASRKMYSATDIYIVIAIKLTFFLLFG